MARRTALALCCACLLAYGYFVYRGPHHNPDSRLALTYAVVERGALDIDRDAAGTFDRARVGGHYYTDKAPGLSFLLVPLYAGLRALLPEALLGPPDRFVARYLLTLLGLGAPAALFASFLYTWLGRLERRSGPRLAVVVGYALGSPAYVFAVSAFGHVPAGLCLFGAFAALGAFARPVGGPRGLCPSPPLPSGQPRRDPSEPTRRRLGLRWAGDREAVRLVGAGALLGLAVALEYPAGLAALAVAAYGAGRARRPRRGAAWLVAGALPLLAALGVYHWAVFGAPWSAGYAYLDPAAPYASGQTRGLLGVGLPGPGTALALLGGLRRGLLVYAPWLILALPGALLLWRRSWRAEVATALGVFALLLAVNSGYVFWDGGASWGPRHLVPALPFLAVVALPAAGRWPRTSWVLVGASAQLTGAAVATRALPDPALAVPLRDVLLPRVFAGAVTNNWGQVVGLAAWRGVVPLLAGLLLCAAWGGGWRRAAGWLVAGSWALVALATLHRGYLEYSEGYYLYLGSRLAAGARLYAEAASTQPPLIPLVVSLLWRLAPDVYLPRLLAVGCYLSAALLAGRLAARVAGHARVAPLATLLAALLPLGAGTVQVLDANSALAPLGPALALLWLGAEGSPGPRRLALAGAAGVVAAAGLSIKLTFLPFALAPLAAILDRRGAWRPRLALLAVYLAGLALAGGAHLAVWYVASGPAVRDGILGELESPLLPPGAALAAGQLVLLEGGALGLAAGGWWGARHTRGVAWWGGLAAGVLPLFALHQGTFVGVARPSEPFLAVYGALAVAGLVAGGGLRRAPAAGALLGAAGLPLLLGAALAVPLWHDLRGLAARPGVDPEDVLARLQAANPAGDVLVPPYYAALAGRRMVFDYADWTVWGMRTAAGAGRERDLAGRLVGALEEGAYPLVAKDFRLDYVPGVAPALERRYVGDGGHGDIPARRVDFFVPRRLAGATSRPVSPIPFVRPAGSSPPSG